MRTLCFVALVAALPASSCKKAEPKPKPKQTGPDCATARSLRTTPSPERLAAISRRCADDAWSPQARACLLAAKATRDVERRFGDHLTPAQWDHLDKDLDRFRRDPTSDEIEQRLTKLESTKNAMCACKDASCVQRVSDEMTRWSIETAKTGTRIPDLIGEPKERATRIGQEMSDCMQALMTAAPAITDAQRYVAKNADFRDRVCACKDKACGEAVAAEMTKWSEDFLADPSDDSLMDTSDQARMETIEKDVHACLRALRAAQQRA